MRHENKDKPMPDRFKTIFWECPLCGEYANEDYLYLTAIPICAKCDKSIEWEDIITKTEGQTKI